MKAVIELVHAGNGHKWYTIRMNDKLLYVIILFPDGAVYTHKARGNAKYTGGGCLGLGYIFDDGCKFDGGILAAQAHLISLIERGE